MSAAMRCVRGALLFALAPSAVLAQALVPGTPASFSLPGNALAAGIYIDVPADAGALRIEADALTAGRDIDLVVRRGSAFASSQAVDVNALFDQAQYRSASSGGDEYLVISKAGVQPLAAGRWHIGVLNFSAQASDVRLTATLMAEAPVVPIEVVYNSTHDGCNIGPWSNGDRRAAMDRAAELLTQQLQPTAPVRVQACWNSTEEDVLAYASAQGLYVHDFGSSGNLPFLPERYSLFASAAAAQRAGTDACRFGGGNCANVFDIRATFGTDADFYYGLDQQSGGQANFISTAMHEITHGLGFYGLISADDGTMPFPWNDPYDANATFNVGNGSQSILELTEAQRVQALTSNNLRFNGVNLKAANGGPSVRLYAPAQANEGSTLSHFDTLTLGGELMAHRISSSAPHDLGLAIGVLYDVGWDPAPKTAPTFPLPESGQYFDPSRNGHGVGLYRVAGTENFYFAAAYTYDAGGEPEFYIANGYVVDGVFVPEANQFSDSLIRTTYDPQQNPPTVHDDSEEFEGRVRIDFNAPAESPACRGDGGAPSAVMSFVLPGAAGSEANQWCMQQIGAGLEVANDLTNIWFNPSDPGWGASTLSFPAGDAEGLAVVIYFPDANGKSRWALAQTGDYQPGVTLPLLQPVGYCRGCPLPDTQQFVEIGTVTVGLTSTDPGAVNTLQFTASQPGAGTFTRDTTVVAGAAPND